MRLDGILRAHSDEDRTEVRFVGGLVSHFQRLRPFEGLPVSRRCCRERRERHTAVPSIEVRVRVHQPVNAVDNRFEAASLDGEVVLEPSGYPDSTHFLEKENSEASRLHGCHMYRPKPYKSQGVAPTPGKLR